MQSRTEQRSPAPPPPPPRTPPFASSAVYCRSVAPGRAAPAPQRHRCRSAPVAQGLPPARAAPCFSANLLRRDGQAVPHGPARHSAEQHGTAPICSQRGAGSKETPRGPGGGFAPLRSPPTLHCGAPDRRSPAGRRAARRERGVPRKGRAALAAPPVAERSAGLSSAVPVSKGASAGEAKGRVGEMGVWSQSGFRFWQRAGPAGIPDPRGERLEQRRTRGRKGSGQGMLELRAPACGPQWGWSHTAWVRLPCDLCTGEVPKESKRPSYAQ